MENVKNLVGKKFKPQFDEWLKYLESLGYTNYWKVLNAKDYGVPQNRERVFVVSILEMCDEYQFPKPIKTTKCVNDILEHEVDNKYYLNDDIQCRFKPIIKNKYKDGIIKIGNASKNMKSQAGTVIDTSGISMTICSGTHGYAMGYICNGAIRGRYNDNKIEQRLELREDNISNTLTTVQKDNVLVDNYGIRRYTPRECFRLMGMSDIDIDKIQDVGMSDTQQYKMAGNSIVVNVLEDIFKNLFIEYIK